MKSKPLILGDEGAAKLLAVEGLHLSLAYKRRINALLSKGFTADQIREALISDLQKRKAA